MILIVPIKLLILSTMIYQILLEAIPTWNIFIHPIGFHLLIFDICPFCFYLTVGMAAVNVSCGFKGRSIFCFSASLPTYTAHLRGWTWWQPPPPRCRLCSSSGRPALSGCPRSAVFRCRWTFPGTCLKHCQPSLSTLPKQKKREVKNV